MSAHRGHQVGWVRKPGDQGPALSLETHLPAPAPGAALGKHAAGACAEPAPTPAATFLGNRGESRPSAPQDRGRGGGWKGEGGGSGAESRLRSGSACRKPGEEAGPRGRLGAGLSPAPGVALCAAGGGGGAGPWARAPGDGEQGAAAPRVRHQPREDEAAAGHRAARLVACEGAPAASGEPPSFPGTGRRCGAGRAACGRGRPCCRVAVRAGMCASRSHPFRGSSGSRPFHFRGKAAVQLGQRPSPG